VPVGLRHLLPSHTVKTADEQGWGLMTNGELLKAAESYGFDVVVTADQNIVYQQSSKNRCIALVVLGTNLWRILRSNANRIAIAVDTAMPGSYSLVDFAPGSGRPTSPV
jgi:hypothetical protein